MFAPILSTHNLTIGYRDSRRSTQVVASGVNVGLRAGELTCLLGPNGAGKSTLIRTLAGTQTPLAGSVALGGDDLHRLAPAFLARRLAVVLTERVEIGNLSAYALVALGRHPYTDWRGRLRTQDEAVVQRVLTQVGAAHLAARPVSELSDGERQRVMIARALAQEPQVLILDEPTAFLDLPGRVEMMHLLASLGHTAGCAILLSTHDLELALRVADMLWLLPKQGLLVTGLPEELALSGALGELFQSEEVRFDPATGSFKLQRQPCGPIGLLSPELPNTAAKVQWTARALERIGFAVVMGDATQPWQVIVNAASWQVIGPQGSRSHATLAGLIAQVRQG